MPRMLAFSYPCAANSDRAAASTTALVSAWPGRRPTRRGAEAAMSSLTRERSSAVTVLLSGLRFAPGRTPRRTKHLIHVALNMWYDSRVWLNHLHPPH